MRPPDDRSRPRTAGPDSQPHDPHPKDHPEDSPLAGLAAVPCQCWECRWYRTCDKAIALNGAIRLEGSHSVMVVADTVVAEVAANGGDIPDTYRLIRDDGRSVYVFIDEEPAA